MENALRFPVPPKPAAFGASSWTILRSRIRSFIGRVLHKMGAPGAVKPHTINDELSGQTIEIGVSATFTRLRVNGRDYYFNRFTGRFDGTGCGCV